MTEPEASDAPKRFGTFTGVFTPTLLTILGVIMYVRLGWVVGNAGLGGTLGILGLAILITACTGLSLASIATNTRIGAGGPYAIMNKSLGLEVGGSIGIPLYLTRPLGVAMYIFGFREGLLWIFPAAPTLLVDFGVFAVLFGIAFISAEAAFKTQYVIMALVAASLVSIFASPAPWQDPVPIQWLGEYPGAPESGYAGTDFWGVFAVLFPATTGILAGANMSGELENPRRSIPVGTLWAIGLSALIYFGIALWCARAGTLAELVDNYTFIIDNSLFPPLVLAGLLGATASSALAGLVGGPRILMAMGQNGVIPFGERLAKVRGGEPRNAMVVTGVLTLGCIMLRDLNAIAPLVTMFFLITYCMINVVVLIEGRLGLVSYRPTLPVPWVVPAVGLVGCLFSMFIINPSFGLISVGVVVVLYFFIGARTRDRVRVDDVRSSIFTAFAEWAASRVTPADMNNIRAWRPHVLVPVEDPEETRGSYPLLLDLAAPEGSVNLLGVPTSQGHDLLEERLDQLSANFRDQGVLSSFSVVHAHDYPSAVTTGLEALQSAFFRPNLLFSRLPSAGPERAAKSEIYAAALRNHVGILVYGPHPSAGLGRRRDINLWISVGSTLDIDAAFGTGNLDLQLLMGYRLSRVWKGKLRLLTVIAAPDQREPTLRYLNELCDLARLPGTVEHVVIEGDLERGFAEAPVADLSILGLSRAAPNLDWAEAAITKTRGSCLFVMVGGRESARA